MPTLYTSADASAPVVAVATAGSLLAAIRACLVTGYGSMSPAGWTEPYTGTNVAAFRNSPSGGTGCYVRIDDTATTGARFVPIVVYETMSDVNTGTYPTTAVHAARYPRNGGATTDLTWFLVADAHTFYFCGRTGTTGNMFLIGAGDSKSLQGSDAFRYFGMGEPGVSSFNTPPAYLDCGSSSNVFLGNAPSANGFTLGRDRTGTSASGGVTHALLLPRMSGSGQHLGGQNLIARPAPNGATEAALQAYFGRTDAIRGYLPGVYLPLSNLSGLAQGTTLSGPDFGGSGSQVIAMLCGGSSPIGAIWVETALGW